jgi:hypothetical protein
VTISVDSTDRNSVASASRIWLSINRFSENKKSINVRGHLYRIIHKSNYNEEDTKEWVAQWV